MGESIDEKIARLEKIQRDLDSTLNLAFASMGFRRRTPEEIEEARRAEIESEKRLQESLRDLYESGRWRDEGYCRIYKRVCPGCCKVFYTQNERRKYDNYYACAPIVWARTQRLKRDIERGRATCPVCGGDFHPRRKGAMYCSGACRQKAYRERKDVTANPSGYK